MPPFVLIIAGIVGGAALVRLAVKEAGRVNRELDEARQRDLNAQGAGAELRRDPDTGAYRPQ